MLLVSATFYRILEGLCGPLYLSPCPELHYYIYYMNHMGAFPLCLGFLFCFLHIFVLLTSFHVINKESHGVVAMMILSNVYSPLQSETAITKNMLKMNSQ